jgi:hypothetical protein
MKKMSFFFSLNLEHEVPLPNNFKKYPTSHLESSLAALRKSTFRLTLRLSITLIGCRNTFHSSKGDAARWFLRERIRLENPTLSACSLISR